MEYSCHAYPKGCFHETQCRTVFAGNCDGHGVAYAAKNEEDNQQICKAGWGEDRRVGLVSEQRRPECATAGACAGRSVQALEGRETL